MKITETPSIKVIPVGQPVGPLHWNMSLDGGQPGGPNHYPKVAVGYGNNADLTFEIVHPGSITFAKDKPILIGPGTAKPTGVDAQFTFSGQGTTKLTVHDSNANAGTYTYVLNFENAPPLDPIIQNDGGGGRAGWFRDNSAAQIIGVLLVLVVAALFVRRMFAKQS
jgi:hypothetical protein